MISGNAKGTFRAAGRVKRRQDLTKRRNLFGLSDDVIGSIMLLIASMIGGIDITIIKLAENKGVTGNAMTLYASIATLIGSLLVDLYFCCVGYAEDTHVCMITHV